MDRLSCILQGVGSLSGQLSGQKTITAGITVPEIVDTDPFQGAYEYTPTQSTQTIPIEGLKALQDIVINPIPNNYGLITWNGSVITVS